ncbi:MAG: mercury(II) reductase [bacterium]|nr:mercury(II) reductase [bacterium]
MSDCCATSTVATSDASPDIAIIGAGSAGFAAAIRAAELGARAVLIGHGAIGGTCVNIGCVPSKTLIRAVETLHNARAASRFAGIHARAEFVDWRAMVAQKDELVGALRHAKYIDLLPEYENVTYLEGQARLVSEGIAVNGTVLRPGKTIITTGASAAIPSIPGLDAIPWLTSTTALELSELPTSLLVIGGGVIGCELAQMFARAGVKVTILCRSRILPQVEPEISAALESYLRNEGIDVRCGVGYRAIRIAGGHVALDLDAPDGTTQVVTAERVLVATGRRPNTAGLDLDHAGVALTPVGGIKVDDRLRTTRAGTYAAGDVTGRDMFVYMAAYGAKIAAENALNGDGRRYDAASMPEVVFTDPQVATVGLTEAQARERRLDSQTVILPLDQVPRAIAARDTRGLIKLVAERESGRLLGAHMLAPEAGDSIQTAVLAIKHGLTVNNLVETIFPYLTTVEGLKLAALGFSKDVAKLSCCAG